MNEYIRKAGRLAWLIAMFLGIVLILWMGGAVYNTLSSDGGPSDEFCENWSTLEVCE